MTVDSSMGQGTGKRPLVTVILPIYNAESTLNQALASVQGQTLANIEILAINDGSTDGSLDIMRARAASDPRVRVIDKQNQGYGTTCDRGIDEARGEWVAILEPDDWIRPGMLKDMTDFAASFTDPCDQPIDIVKTPYWRVSYPDTDKQRILHCSYYRRIHPSKQPFTITDPGVVDILCHHPSIWSAIYRKGFLDSCGIRFPHIPGAGWADNPFLMETMLQAKRIVYLEKAYYCYRENTPAEDVAFTEKNPLLPFERWNDMQDVIERLGVTDAGVQRAHNSRGFTYLSGVIEIVPMTDPKVNAAMRHMFDRMDPDLVLGSRKVSPGMKRLFAETRGLPEPKPGYLSYARSLVGEGAYQLSTNGVGAAAEAVSNYVQKYRVRNGEAAPDEKTIERELADDGAKGAQAAKGTAKKEA